MMRALLSLVVFVLSFCATAQANYYMEPSLLIRPTQPVAVTYITTAYNDTLSQTTKTFSSVSFGSPDPTRQIVVYLNRYNGAGSPVSALSIGGVSATLLVSGAQGDAFAQTAIWSARVPNGASGNIVATQTSGTIVDVLAIGVYAVYNAKSAAFATATDNTISSNAFSFNLAAPAQGAIVSGVTGDFLSARTIAWTNLTEDFEGAGGRADLGYSGAKALFPTATTPTITSTYSGAILNGVMIGASFSPLF